MYLAQSGILPLGTYVRELSVFRPMRFFRLKQKFTFFFLCLCGVVYGSTVGKLKRNKIA